MFSINSVDPSQKIVKNYVTAKADSGASCHCFKKSDEVILNNLQHDSNGPTLLLPNLQTIKANRKGSLPINLSPAATSANIFNEDDLKNASLISLGQLCDDDCKVFLDKHKLLVYKDNKKIIHGSRNRSDGLWDVHFPTKKITKHYANQALKKNNKLNIIIHKDKSKQELAAYLHACAFSPPKQTFIDAIQNNNFITWPGLTTKLIRKWLCLQLQQRAILTRKEKTFKAPSRFHHQSPSLPRHTQMLA